MPTIIPIARNTTQMANQRKICCALYTDILSTQPGLCKLGELIFGGICVGLMVTYGTPVWLTLGFAYPLFLVNSSAALLFTCVTLFCYLISEHTFRAIRTTVLFPTSGRVYVWPTPSQAYNTDYPPPLSLSKFAAVLQEEWYKIPLEIVQNGVSAILYAVGSAFLLMHTTFFLWPMYIIIPYFQAYPALMTAGVFGCLSGFVHAIDGYFAYRTFKSIHQDR